MSLFGASHFTALLAAIAIVGTAGSFWWAMEIHADLKSGTGTRSTDRALPSKPASRTPHAKDERSNKFASFRKSDRPQPSPPGRGEDRDPLPERTAPAPPLVSVNYASPTLQDKGADMPLPIPPVRSDREPPQAKIPEPPVALPPLPTENPKRQSRGAGSEPAAAARSAKPPARSFYIEKFVEQGDAGEVRFRYQRHSCEPPNMPDVCFMPQESRRGIVVERR